MNKISLLLLIVIVLIQSCVSTAKLSDFPQTSKDYDFNKIANSKKSEEDKKWNSKTGFEYYLKTSSTNDTVIIKAIIVALRREGFLIKGLNRANGVLLGERGLRANEWKSVIGIYYQKTFEGYEVYLKCKITQDITGGWREDRAKKIGDIICELLKTCSQAYSVNTNLSK